MSGYQVDLHLFNICYFRSIPERQPRNRNHKTHVSVEQYGQNEALQKRQSDQFLQQMCFKGFKVSSPMVIHIGHLQSWYNQICILHGG